LLRAAAPLTSEEDASRRLDKALDAMARRICLGVVLAVRSLPDPVLWTLNDVLATSLM
jgi:hypothetical protein